MVDVFPDKSTGNNIPEGTGWVRRVERYNHVSTTMSMKLYVGGLLYHNIPLKGMNKVDILNRIYIEPQKKRNCCDNIINKETKKKVFR